MSLSRLGLRAGEEIRFRRLDRGRWQPGSVRRLEADGSIGVVDANGALRSVASANVEVRVAGPRGAARWEPLLERAARTEQLDLLEPGPDAERSAQRGRSR
jgi:hypothetical protein